MVAKLEEPELVTVMVQCAFCDEMIGIELDGAKVRRWLEGELCQNVWPELTPEERDVLITKICIPCQRKHGV